MDRCASLRLALQKKGLSAAIVHRPENMRYLTGYTGEGCVAVTPARQVILTDFRYVEQAGQQAPACECIRTTAEREEAALLKDILSAEGVFAAAVEDDFLTHTAYVALEKALEGVTLASAGGMVETMRTVKDPTEAENIIRASEIACRAFEKMLGIIHEGMTEREVRLKLDFTMLELGSEGNAFETIVASGENGSLCHAVVSDRVLKKGDLVTMDFGAKVNGYCSDITRTVAIGRPSDEMRKVYDAVLEAQLAALSYIAPGKVARDVDKVARDRLDRLYPGAFGHSLGHGVGLFIHEEPRLSPRCETVLLPGHAVTVEPGVYLQGLGGCRIEDTVILTESGFIDPMTAPKELIIL